MDQVLQEINGRHLADGSQLPRFHALANDGSTACGCWIYSGVFDGGNKARTSAIRTAAYGHGWGYAWPIGSPHPLQPRLGARPTERRGASARSWCGGIRGKREWTGHDVADFRQDKAPDYEARSGEQAATKRCPATRRSSCIPTAWAGSGSPSGLKDGPLPAHYEPLESPVAQRALRTADQSRGRSEGASRQPVRRLARRSALSRMC